MKLAWAVFAAALSSLAAADPIDNVRCREIGFSRAAETRDAGRFRSYIDADARFLGNEVLRGPDEILDAWQAFLDPGGPAIQWRPRFVEVLDDGRLAMTRGPYRVLSDPAGDTVAERWGTFNSVWRLHDDGEWRVVFDAGSPGNEAPSEADRELLAAPVDCEPGGGSD